MGHSSVQVSVSTMSTVCRNQCTSEPVIVASMTMSQYTVTAYRQVYVKQGDHSIPQPIYS